MNRRTFLSALAATSLTPILPPQVFASGGIVNPLHCGFVGDGLLPYQREALVWLGKMPAAPAAELDNSATTYAGYRAGKSWVDATPEQIRADINTMMNMVSRRDPKRDGLFVAAARLPSA